MEIQSEIIRYTDCLNMHSIHNFLSMLGVNCTEKYLEVVNINKIKAKKRKMLKVESK